MFAASGLARADDSLEARIRPLIDAHKGKIAVAVRNLATGDGFEHNADVAMPTASLIKLAVMVEAYAQSEEKKLDLEKKVTLTKADKVQGSGILTPHFSEGASFSVRDAVRLMIAFSDNTATNLVIDQVGLKNVNTRMESLGFPSTRINAKVFRGDTRLDAEFGKKYGLGATTAAETVALLGKIHAGQVISPAACTTMIDHLKTCDDKEMLVRYLPAGTIVAHKTGAVNAARTEGGIIFVPDPADKKKTRPVAVCVLTNDNEDRTWTIDNQAQVTIAKIGRAVFDHFSK